MNIYVEKKFGTCVSSRLIDSEAQSDQKRQPHSIYSAPFYAYRIDYVHFFLAHGTFIGYFVSLSLSKYSNGRVLGYVFKCITALVIILELVRPPSIFKAVRLTARNLRPAWSGVKGKMIASVCRVCVTLFSSA